MNILIRSLCGPQSGYQMACVCFNKLLHAARIKIQLSKLEKKRRAECLSIQKPTIKHWLIRIWWVQNGFPTTWIKCFGHISACVALLWWCLLIRDYFPLICAVFTHDVPPPPPESKSLAPNPLLMSFISHHTNKVSINRFLVAMTNIWHPLTRRAMNSWFGFDFTAAKYSSNFNRLSIYSICCHWNMKWEWICGNFHD